MNHLTQDDAPLDILEYQTIESLEADYVNDDHAEYDQVNFLDTSACYLSGEHFDKVFFKEKDADALSRQSFHPLDSKSNLATIHSELSLTCFVESTDKIINCFQNQKKKKK